MRLKLIACKVLGREIARICAESKNFIDVTYIRQGYHNEPEKLREILQREINRVDSGDDPHSCNTVGQAYDFDAILLGYGLCSNGTAGVFSRKYPVVVPRAHDCITLFLGSAPRYRRIFDECSGGVYWYAGGWIENCPMPCLETERDNLARYIARYGRDNGEYLVARERESLKNYSRAAFIDTGFKTEEYRAFTKEAAAYYGWEYCEYQGDISLLSDFLNSRWDEERFLKLPPRYVAAPSYDEHVIRAEKLEK